MIQTAGSAVHTRVYRDLKDKNNPESGTLAVDQTETVNYGGYHTLSLEQAVPLVAGETFSVIQEISGSDGYYWPIETGTGMYDFYGMEGTFHCIAQADAAEAPASCCGKVLIRMNYRCSPQSAELRQYPLNHVRISGSA